MPFKVQNRTRRLFDLLAGFFLGQAAVQGISVVTGIFLVRSLSIHAYAEYGLALGFQSTAAILMDLGFAGTVIPLVGERASDRAWVGKYVRGAKSLRDRTFWIFSPVIAVLFLVITNRQGWPLLIQSSLLASILIALYSSSSMAYYSAPLFLHRRMRDFYIPQALTGGCRLLLYLLLSAVGALNSIAAAGCSALNVAVNGFLLRKKGLQYIDLPERDEPEVRKEIIQYVMPAIPAILLGAFHGQIALLLISIFGSTVNIAQVSALGRLGQLFNLLMTFNIVIVEPYVARLEKSKLFSTYFRLVSLAAIGGAGLSLLAFAAPGTFLWILGPKYEELRNLIGWVVLTACINYVAGLIWIMNRSRKWVFWRGTVAEISALAVVQLGFLIIFGVKSTKAAVFFNFASSFCYVFAHSYIAIYGFGNGRREEQRADTVGRWQGDGGPDQG
jgi:O-antigen/teichoic acid export membrane protein